MALTTFSDLVGEARERIRRDAVAAGLPDDDRSLDAGGTGAKAYAEAVSVYLALALQLRSSFDSFRTWEVDMAREQLVSTFARQAFHGLGLAEANPFARIRATSRKNPGFVVNSKQSTVGSPGTS